jgi:hypothetical protein
MNAISWNVTPYGSCENRRFGWKCCFYYRQLLVTADVVHNSLIRFILMMEKTRSPKTSVLTRPTWRHIPEDDILYSQRREKLKSYIWFKFQFLTATNTKTAAVWIFYRALENCYRPLKERYCIHVHERRAIVLQNYMAPHPRRQQSFSHNAFTKVFATFIARTLRNRVHIYLRLRLMREVRAKLLQVNMIARGQ